jgi:periplasmic divalent cation tolerance protein
MSESPEPDTHASLVYVTCSTVNEALSIGDAVVRARLAACANVIEGMRSLYWWEGDVQEDAETVLLLKTTPRNVGELTAKVCDLHSYDVPCVVEIPLGQGNPDYFAWIAAEASGISGAGGRS